MKYWMILLMFGAFLFQACQGGGSSDKEAPAVTDEMIADGAQLVAYSDCKTCHDKTEKKIGPSHTGVAEKYEFTEANVDLLAKKIMTGGSGVWGDIPMTPHVGLSEEDAKKMAAYVLSLDGEKFH